ncbi:hypothetical protein P3875_08375 [Myroides sp. JBRI-B21084]|uniref:hypothetical protein n=1 Tax=Myroides sp. JBRI-B21084 TaxID=3119977 RepID=UPI0026E40BEC|nr:hypothetical protein [Paenimyroides cloacae]WKW45799.1 hypothetical protein P3875_08375 [Paenimyroides cloacae]
MITAEAGKGNVLIITTTSTKQEGLTFRQANDFLTTLWNNRTPGNNIIKFEYEFYGEGSFVFYGNLMNYFVTKPSVINTAFQSIPNIYHRILGNYLENSSSYKIHVLKNYNATTFPYNTWIKAEMFVDYNTKNVYFYIPTLNLQATGTFNHNTIPTYIDFGTGSLDATSVVK